MASSCLGEAYGWTWWDKRWMETWRICTYAMRLLYKDLTRHTPMVEECPQSLLVTITMYTL
jgi:hypothetical protein